ncbi:MAG: hypothetical protein IKG21_03940 [Atopobiaceae bacterium]|nr:hypothetical protein [Atopobiaceae bacterium]
MQVVLDGETAYEYWMLHNPHTEASAENSPRQPLTSFESLSNKQLDDAIGQRDGSSGKMHLICDYHLRPHAHPNTQCHVWSSKTPLPPKSIYQIGPGLYTVSPELCLVRLASQVDRLTLLHMTTNMLGLFAFNYYEKMELVERDPITTIQKVQTYLNAIPHAQGTKVIRQILSWVHERSRSPRESTVSLCLGIPTRVGGLALPSFEVNRKIKLSDEARLLTTKNYLEADFAWMSKKTLLEYNSDEWHYGSDRVARDLEKIAALQQMDYTTVPVTTRQFDDYDTFKAIVGNLRKHLGQRDRANEDAEKRRSYLHSDLIETERTQRELLPFSETARWQWLWPRLDYSIK